MNKGYIYLITNDINDKVYVGQTSRSVEERFKEHKWDSRNIHHPSQLHKAIKELGMEHFSVTTLEEVELDQLDNREKYWIKKYDSINKGYNMTLGGQGIHFPGTKIQVVENGIVFSNIATAAKLISFYTSWKIGTIAGMLSKVVNTEKTFCDYHFRYIYDNIALTDELTIEDWIITLNIRYQGQKIYCIQLDKEFDTVGSAARYILDNNLYLGKSKMPIQSLITAIGKQLKGETNFLSSTIDNLQFIKLPGTTKQEPTYAAPQKIYCPELDKTFETQVEAAKFMLDNKYWENIKLKTAKLRVSDVVRGIFPDYKGYTFQKV